MKRHLLLIFTVACLSSCSLLKKGQIDKQIEFAENLYQNHIGFVLYDPETKEYFYERNSDRYFTPASNTKIFTLYTGLVTLGEKAPALYYMEKGDSLIFWGTGDPSLLNGRLSRASDAYDFLKNTDKELYFSGVNYADERFGPGWAWDDYQYTFSAEKSPLPIYGNTVSVNKKANSKHLEIDVPYFKRYFYLQDSSAGDPDVIRHIEGNEIDYFPVKQGQRLNKRWPFRYSDLLLSNLLTDTLGVKVGLVDTKLPKSVNLIESVPMDTLYLKMMQDSDNFIAEQILLMCSSQLSDTLSTTGVINYMKDQYLYDLPDDITWMDGSGLSRYNLFTARSIVRLWEKIYSEMEEDRLFGLLAVGGESGTLKNYYKASKPYIYGKTGTLSNNHNLSGFIKTDSGKTLIFAYMNNNHIVSSREVKKEMERLLLSIKQKY